MPDSYSGNVEVIFDKSDLAGSKLQEQVGAAIAKAAFSIETLAKQKIMDGPKTGRIYKHGNVLHQASAPGESPANDLGDLANSFETHADGAVTDLEAEVVVNSDHAIYLEFGTHDIEPRPFLTPAAEEVAPQLDDDIASLRLIDG